MKYIIYLLAFVLLITSVHAGVAGEEQVVYHFDYCTHLDVDVFGEYEITPGEYQLLDCTQVTPNTWSCDCTDDYDLMILPGLRTINTYNFDILFDYSLNIRVGGGGGTTYYVNSTNETDVLNETNETAELIEEILNELDGFVDGNLVPDARRVENNETNLTSDSNGNQITGAVTGTGDGFKPSWYIWPFIVLVIGLAGFVNFRSTGGHPWDPSKTKMFRLISWGHQARRAGDAAKAKQLFTKALKHKKP